MFKGSRHIYDQIYGKVFGKTILKQVAFFLSKMQILLKNIKYNFISHLLSINGMIFKRNIFFRVNNIATYPKINDSLILDIKYPREKEMIRWIAECSHSEAFL